MMGLQPDTRPADFTPGLAGRNYGFSRGVAGEGGATSHPKGSSRAAAGSAAPPPRIDPVPASPSSSSRRPRAAQGWRAAPTLGLFVTPLLAAT